MKYLVCVYTCDREPYRTYLQELCSQDWFKKLKQDPDVSIYYVYADASCTESRIDGGRLTLAVQEEYSRLAAKTYEMIRYLVVREEFDYLIKVDDSVVTQYFGRLLQNLDIRKMCNGDYGGAELMKANQRVFVKFGRAKKLRNVLPTPYMQGIFFKGKFYFLSKRACEILAGKGKSLLPVFLERVGGAEDAFVGKVLEEAGVMQPNSLRWLLRLQRDSIRRKYYKIAHVISCYLPLSKT
ncbi:MAG: hypothetical protein PHO92_01400 [Candidatus Peribacteraceae bacterium]|nr:hypothetical protein [Candidatus Peribacteraceae bacterium]